MRYARWMRWVTRSKAGIRIATILLYVMVLIGGAATLLNLYSFRESTLAEARRQTLGLAAGLASHIRSPVDRQEETWRIAPLHAGLGEDAVIAVFDRERAEMLSLPASAHPALPAFVRSALERSGNFEAPWPGDGIERIWGFANDRSDALQVLVGLSRTKVTAPVVLLAWHMTALMAALVLGALLLAHLLHHLLARRRVEEALHKTSRAAVVAAKAKAAFLANMSHELRTPMTGVLGMADLLMGTQLDQEQTRMLSTMRASARTLLTVLNDVLDFSKIEAGQLELEHIDFDLREVTGDAVRLLTPAASEKGLTVTTDIDPACPRWVLGDPSRLQQVLFNLIGNAIKFTDHGGVTVRLRPAGEGIAFAVEDTGIGISPEAMARLFTPFSQADTSTTRRYGGTGLGLAISKRLVALMGGAVTAKSKQGAGSTFSFTLVLPQGSEPAERDSDGVVPSGRPLNILLAEDNPVNQTLVASMLERMGHTVTLAEHGAQALELAAAHDFDAVLMDMQMPVMDGETATRLIRALPGNKALLPVIALTADAVLEHRDRYLETGLDAFLTKPVSWKLLARTLDEATAGHAVEVPPKAPFAPAAEPMAGLSDLPVLDNAYLEDMRQWVGDSTLLGLLATAPDSFTGELAAIRSAWNAKDLQTVRETGHRLKGAAGSVGCRRLADLGHQFQKLEPQHLEHPDRLAALESEIDRAVAEVTAWRPATEAIV